MIYKRYQFNNQEQAEEKIDDFFDLDENGNKVQNIKAAFIKLNKFVLVKGDDENDSVLSDGYALDVLWYELEESPYGWKSYEVTPKKPKHKLL